MAWLFGKTGAKHDRKGTQHTGIDRAPCSGSQPVKTVQIVGWVAARDEPMEEIQGLSRTLTTRTTRTSTAEPVSRLWVTLPTALFAHDGSTTEMGGSDPVRCVPFILCVVLTMTVFGFDD